MFLPDAFDTELMKRTFMEIVEGKMVKIPVYDFKTSSRYIYRYIPTVTPASIEYISIIEDTSETFHSLLVLMSKTQS